VHKDFDRSKSCVGVMVRRSGLLAMLFKQTPLQPPPFSSVDRPLALIPSSRACSRWQPGSRPDTSQMNAPPQTGRPVGRLAVALAFDLLAPSRGRAQVLRSGQPGMDAGLAAPGHGWPMAAGPRSRTGARACRAWARHRTKGARALGYLGPGGVPLFQVTRCKSGTISRRYRRNGYVHP
jgi:hypothetical protein